jgi:NADH-quinone oxidoreductase subunit M
MSALYLVFGPILLAGVLALFVKVENSLSKYIALLLFMVGLEFSISLFGALPSSGYLDLGSYLSVERFGFVLTLQVDQLSAIMLTLTSLMLILVTLSSWSMKNQAAYFNLLILFAGPIFGVFMSTNFLWFFIFWELTLVPMYFLVGIWGAEGRIYAAIKFFLYTHVASMFILLAFFLIYKESGTFDMTLVKESMLLSPVLIWWLLFIGFAVKMPIFPFHTWLPDAHVQAPAPVSALLAGVLLKMGAYAMIRMVILMMPEHAAQFSWVILTLGLITLFYAGFMALYETHLKKMVAYSSISHMGLVTIAIGTLSYSGLSAALYEMIGHALIISPLFLIAGFLHHRTGSWQMAEMGGLMQKAPYLSAIFVLSGLAALGLPGTMGFIGELSILISAIDVYGMGLIVIALASMIGASYIIWTFRRVIYGEISEEVTKADFSMNRMEFLALLVFAVLVILFGLMPSLLYNVIDPAFSQLSSFGGAL